MENERLSKSIIPDSGISFEVRKLSNDFPRHWHEFYELEYVLDGEATYITNGIPFHVEKGGLVFVVPADFHEIQIRSDSLTVCNIMFTDEWIEKELQQSFNTSAVIRDYKFFPLEKLDAEFNSDVQQNALCIRYLLNAVLIDVARNTKEQSLLPVYHKPIQKALNYIHHHFRENITLKDVTANTGYSPNHFSKLFRDNVGMTYVKYVSDLKLSYAASLLITFDANITDICFQSGFNTFSHFQLCFKKKYGVSPGEYRNTMRRQFRSPAFAPIAEYSPKREGQPCRCKSSETTSRK